MNAINLLNKVLELFKKYKDNSKILEQLLKHNMLHSSFEQRYILNNNVFHFVLADTVVVSDYLVEFYLTASDRCPYRVEIVFDERWYLKSLLFMCPACMGEDEECNVCGGSGWGVL